MIGATCHGGSGIAVHHVQRHDMRDKTSQSNHEEATRLRIFLEPSVFVPKCLPPWLIGSRAGRLRAVESAPNQIMLLDCAYRCVRYRYMYRAVMASISHQIVRKRTMRLEYIAAGSLALSENEVCLWAARVALPLRLM
jgi:hypothetical protein